MATRMQQRRGTAADFAAQNPILAEGELGFETDTKIIKVGDGVTAWNALITPYLTAGGGTMTGHLSLITPTDPNHAARLADVQAATTGEDRVLKSGDTMTGRLNIDNATHQQHLQLSRSGNEVNLTVGNPVEGPASETRVNAALLARFATTLATIYTDLTVNGIIKSDNPRVWVQSADPGASAKLYDLWGW